MSDADEPVYIPPTVSLVDMARWEQHIWKTPDLSVVDREAAILFLRLKRGDLGDDTQLLLRLSRAPEDTEGEDGAVTQRLSTEQAAAHPRGCTCIDCEHPGYITASDIVRDYKTTRAYVYKLASTRGWRRYRLDGQLRYHAGDVDDALGEDPKRPARNAS